MEWAPEKGAFLLVQTDLAACQHCCASALVQEPAQYSALVDSRCPSLLISLVVP